MAKLERGDSSKRITEKILSGACIEDILTQIWSRLLNIQQVGLHANFFDLGGDSLLAVRLFSEIERATGQELPFTTIFAFPTIAGLSSVLEQSVPPPFTCLTLLKDGIPGPALFIIHGMGGTVTSFMKLGSLIQTRFRIYGIQAIGLDGTCEPHTRIEDMARYYLQEVRTVQPLGPYFLSGYSFGGLVAFEMARLIIKDGQKVGLLAILDTHAMLDEHPIFHHLRMIRNMDYRQIPFYVLGKMYGKLSRRIRKRTPPVEIQVVPEGGRLTYAHYQPGFYDGKMVFFKAEPHNRYYATLWCKHTKEVVIHTVPGDHLSMLCLPHVVSLATEISRHLNSAFE